MLFIVFRNKENMKPQIKSYFEKVWGVNRTVFKKRASHNNPKNALTSGSPKSKGEIFYLYRFLTNKHILVANRLMNIFCSHFNKFRSSGIPNILDELGDKK